MIQHIDYPREYLNLVYTLTCGQAFRWKLDDDGYWAAPVCGKVVRTKEDETGFLWETIPGDPDAALLSDYFRLNDDIRAIYSHLSQSDGHVADLIDRYHGLRLLRQNPEETILSYVCSTANSVPRISRSIERFSQKYGQFIAEVGGRDHYSFPTVNALASADPTELTNIGGLGWRGSNIVMVAKQMLDHGEGWLDGLRSVSYHEAKRELLALRGIGSKIADCVCLFSLDKDEAVPVDTHIRQVAVRYYMPGLTTKTITASAYEKIVGVFREKFGEYAGWAQELLYYEDLMRGRRARVG